MTRTSGRILFCLLLAGLAMQPASAAGADEISAAPALTRADFHKAHASREARQVADWVVLSGDNHVGDQRRLPFVIVDKKQARVFVFDALGDLRGDAAALLGQARGDDSAPGIGDRELRDIRPNEKTTPAGRFVSSLGGNMRNEDVLWVDYATATSMHRVLTTNAKERRAQRLASPTVLDNRISYGCINIPVPFYEKVVRPAFTGTQGIVYVLPEVKTIRQVFAGYTDDEPAEPPAKTVAAKTPVRKPVSKSPQPPVNAAPKRLVQ